MRVSKKRERTLFNLAHCQMVRKKAIRSLRSKAWKAGRRERNKRRGVARRLREKRKRDVLLRWREFQSSRKLEMYLSHL